MLTRYKKICIVLLIDYECVAQLVEHLTFNQRALGSSPSTLTIYKNTLPCAGLFLYVRDVPGVRTQWFGERGGLKIEYFY